MYKNNIPHSNEEKDVKLLGNKKARDDIQDSQISEYDSSYFSYSSDIEVKSFTQKKTEQNIKEKYIQVFEIKTRKNKNIEIDKISGAIREKDYNFLNKYAFPYKTLSFYNTTYMVMDTNTFRKLNFFCPICKEQLRHYSIYYHIFQFHFKEIKGHLTQRDIARSCARLIDKEYEKIKNSVELLSELAILYNSCNFTGYSVWRNLAQKQIEEIKSLNVDNLYFNKTLENVMNNLNKKLPLNENKNKTKKRIFKKKDKY